MNNPIHEIYILESTPNDYGSSYQIRHPFLFIYLCNSLSSLDQLQKQNKQKTVDKSDIEQIF